MASSLPFSKHVLAPRHQNAAELLHVRAGFTDDLLAGIPVVGLYCRTELGAHAFDVV